MPGRRKCRRAGLQDLRLQALHLLDEPPCLEQEHAAVPGIFAAREIGFGGLAVWLLDELGDREAARSLVEHLSALDVAVAGFRPVGRDAEGDQPAGLGGAGAGRNHGLEAGNV